MSMNKYLSINSKELYDLLVADVLKNISEGKLILDDLMKEFKYQADYEFRAVVDTVNAIVLGMSGNDTKVIIVCTELIDRTTALNMWRLLSTNWNVLGLSYRNMGIFERAIECFYNVIKVERKHQFSLITSIAYNNIAQIHYLLNDYYRAQKYFDLAIKSLKESGKNEPRYNAKMILHLSNYIKVLSQIGEVEKMPLILEEMDSLEVEKTDQNTIFSYYIAKMYYYFYIKDFSAAKQAFLKASSQTSESNIIYYYALISEYVELCNAFELEFDFYINEIKKVEELQSANYKITSSGSYKKLRHYYQSIGDMENYHKILEQNIKYWEGRNEGERLRQCESLQLIEDFLSNENKFKEIQSKNTELELVAQEAIRHKNLLQKAYNQIETINMLGQKMTSSLKLSEVVDLIYGIIKSKLPIDSFVLFALEENGYEIRSVAYYEHDVLKKNFTVNFKEKNGFFAECYRKNKIISTADKDYQEFFKLQKSIQKYSLIKSAIYMPLVVQNEIIGFCSIQDSKENVYDDSHIKFLKALSPYLSISLNNALHSWKLEKQIQLQLQTQEELKKANIQLENISSLDGLTQINNRRKFDEKIGEMIDFATINDKKLSIFMIDIDNFKLYNDTYGHLQGDETLKIVAKIFRDNMDKVGGMSARFGGEEFIGACLDLSYEECESLADTIRQNIFDLNIKNEKANLKRVTVSIGIAITDSIATVGKSGLMKVADDSLYIAKNSGKNKVIINGSE